MSTRHYSAASAWAAAVVVALVPGVSAGTEWYADPAVDARFEYDDNFRLRNDEDKIEIAGLRFKPRVNVGANAERWRVDLDTRVEFRRYNKDQFDTDNQSVELSSAWGRQTWGLALEAAYIKDSTTNSELDDFTGLVELEATRRTQGSVRPVVNWQFSERDQLSFGGSVRDTRYESDQFTDYDYNSLDISWSRTLSPQMSLQVSPYFTRFESSPSVRSDTLGLTVGLTNVISERWRANAVVGTSRVETDRIGCTLFFFNACLAVGDLPTDETTGFVGEIGASYSGERWAYGGRLSRNYSPSGNGYLLVRDEFKGNADYFLTGHLTALLSLTAQSSESVEAVEGFDRDYYRVAVGLRYRVSERLNIVGQYTYRDQERRDRQVDNESAPRQVIDANANGFHVEFRYKFKRRTWSL